MKIYIFTTTTKQMEFKYKFVSSIKYYITNVYFVYSVYFYVLFSYATYYASLKSSDYTSVTSELPKVIKLTNS